jgi:hypothetical protein
MIAILITQSYAAPILMARAHRTHRHVVEHVLTQRGNGLFGGLSAMPPDCGGVAAFPQSNLYGKGGDDLMSAIAVALADAD